MLVTQKQSNFYSIVIITLLLSDKHDTQNNNNREQYPTKQSDTQKQQDEELALKEQLNNLNDKSYIEKVARDDYYLSNDGDSVT
jgi:cell division protein DivIC